jgi:hypothetical protein
MSMPVLAIVYAIFLSVVMIVGVHQKIKKNRLSWLITAGAAQDVALLFLFVGYWTPSILRPIGPFAFVVFVCCLGALVINSIPGLLRDIDAPEFGPELNALQKAFWLTIGILGELPAYSFGGIAAWRAL